MDAGLLTTFLLSVVNVPMWLSIIFTWAHCAQEVHGDLVGYFQSFSAKHATATVTAPRTLLVIAFGPALAAIMTTLAIVGYSQFDMVKQGSVVSLALAALLGARLGDCVYSHWLLSRYKSGNPGLSTTIAYVIEIALITVILDGGPAELAVSLTAAQSFWIINPLIGFIAIREERVA